MPLVNMDQLDGAYDKGSDGLPKWIYHVEEKRIDEMPSSEKDAAVQKIWLQDLEKMNPKKEVSDKVKDILRRHTWANTRKRSDCAVFRQWKKDIANGQVPEQATIVAALCIWGHLRGVFFDKIDLLTQATIHGMTVAQWEALDSAEKAAAPVTNPSYDARKLLRQNIATEPEAEPAAPLISAPTPLTSAPKAKRATKTTKASTKTRPQGLRQPTPQTAAPQTMIRPQPTVAEPQMVRPQPTTTGPRTTTTRFPDYLGRVPIAHVAYLQPEKAETHPKLMRMVFDMSQRIDKLETEVATMRSYYNAGIHVGMSFPYGEDDAPATVQPVQPATPSTQPPEISVEEFLSLPEALKIQYEERLQGAPAKKRQRVQPTYTTNQRNMFAGDDGMDDDDGLDNLASTGLSTGFSGTYVDQHEPF